MDRFEPTRGDRAFVAMSARCRTDAGSRAYAAVLNLSEEGCCLLMKEATLREGQRVQLWPDGLGNLVAQVQWTNDRMAGLKFESPLYGPVFEHLMKIYARPDDLGTDPNVTAKGGDLPKVLREELEERIRRREAADVRVAPKVDALYSKISIVGTRPGLSTRKTDEKLVQLFLG